MMGMIAISAVAWLCLIIYEVRKPSKTNEVSEATDPLLLIRNNSKLSKGTQIPETRAPYQALHEDLKEEIPVSEMTARHWIIACTCLFLNFGALICLCISLGGVLNFCSSVADVKKQYFNGGYEDPRY